MRKAGGIIAVVAGGCGVIAAFITLFVGGVGSAIEAEGAETVVWLGWGGVFLSFCTIGLAAATIASKGRITSVLLIICAIAGALLGGTMVAVFMALAIIGAIVALFEKPAQKELA